MLFYKQYSKIPRKDFLCIPTDEHTFWLLFVTVLALLLTVVAPSHQPRQWFKIWDHYFYSEQHHVWWELLQFQEGCCSVAQCMPFKHTGICMTEPVAVLCLECPRLAPISDPSKLKVQLKCVQHCHASGNGRQKSRLFLSENHQNTRKFFKLSQPLLDQHEPDSKWNAIQQLKTSKF